MSTRTGLVTALFVASAGSALGAPVRHAGEWQTTLDNGAPRVACFPTDKVYDQRTVMRPLAQLPGANCKMNSMNTLGPVTTYSMQCVIGGNVMTTNGTVVMTGPDAFTSKMHSHGGVIPMAGGRTMVMPDTDMTLVSRRLGPCKPGERVNPY